MSLINEHNVNIIDIDKKEINLFLKVKDSFDFIRSNEENLFSLHDEIVLKNKYGQILIKDLFLLFKKIFFIEVDENLIYFNYIDIIPIYIKTKNGLLKSRYYNMENYFYALIENTYKQNLQINEGINKQRIKVMGSCVYTKESQTPIFNGFFSLGLSTYNLFKIIELLKPNKKLLYLSLEKADDNNQIRAQAIAERIVMNSKELFETVLLFERDVRNI